MRLFYLHYPQGGLLVCFLVHIDSFCYYLTSNAPAKTQEAEENQAKEEKAETVQGATGQMARAVEQQTTRTVEQWMAKGGHRTAGITSPLAAAEMGIPRYQLTAWVKGQGYESFSHWITTLRLEETKRMLEDHPDWSTEAVADYCGFSSREYFHRLFRQHQGMTPSQYQQTTGGAAAK